MSKFGAVFATLVGLSLGSAGLAGAQSVPETMPPSARQGGMCGGMCGTAAQGTPMPGMTHGQGGMMQGGCPMMRNAALMEERLRRLEERSGVPTPPGQPDRSPG